MHLLDIHTTLFTVLSYPMSYIEFFGTVFNIWCVWLVAKGKILTWPVGIVGILLYIALFYQIQLYSDLIEQLYFLVMSFYGWWMWSSLRQRRSASVPLPVSRLSSRTKLISVGATAVGTLVFSYGATQLPVWLPSVFSEPASYPLLDAFTTVMSFLATILMARKKVECWHLWILVDLIGIGLYYVKGVKFISLEYVLFLGLAINGLLSWRKTLRSAMFKAPLEHTPVTAEP